MISHTLQAGFYDKQSLQMELACSKLQGKQDMKKQLAALKMILASLTSSLGDLQSQLNATHQTMSAEQQRSEDLRVNVKKEIKEGHLLKQFLQTSMASKEEALQVMQLPLFDTCATFGPCCSQYTQYANFFLLDRVTACCIPLMLLFCMPWVGVLLLGKEPMSCSGAMKFEEDVSRTANK